MGESYVYTDQDVDSSLRSPLDLSQFERLLQDLAEGTNDGIKVGPFFGGIQLPLKKVEQFKYGQSNPTYLLTDSKDFRFVLRRKPTANKHLISSKSHNIEREFDFLSALGYYKRDHDPSLAVAKTFLLCEDESYIGCRFYLMEFVEGVIFHDPFMSSLPEPKRKQCWNNAVKTLSRIHLVKVEKLKRNLPSNYFPHQSASFFQRQVKTLSKISKLQSSYPGMSPIPHFEKTSNWLLCNSPKDLDPPVLIHGDYKVDNLVFNLDTCEVIAVLDWELTTLGHPIFDLANLLQPNCLPESLNITLNSSSKTSPFPNCVKYCLDTYYEYNSDWGHPSTCWKCGVVFGFYRVAVITQGVSMRSKKGVASSAQAEKFGKLFTVFGSLAQDEIAGDAKL